MFESQMNAKTMKIFTSIADKQTDASQLQAQGPETSKIESSHFKDIDGSIGLDRQNDASNMDEGAQQFID